MGEIDSVLESQLCFLRNEITRIDDSQVYGMLKSNLGDFEAFAAGIVDFLAVDERQRDA